MIWPLSLVRDRLARRFVRWGWSVTHHGRGDWWLLPTVYVVKHYRYLKLAGHFLKWTVTYERCS